MSKFTVIRDTREKEGHGWWYEEDAYCIGTEATKLDVGDYSIKDKEHILCIERKESISELAGNCGSSFCAPLEREAREMLHARVSQYTQSFDVTWSDFDGYLNALESAGSTVNIGLQVGHGTVRSSVIGLKDRAPDGQELDRMKALVAESLDSGALGISLTHQVSMQNESLIHL